MRAWAVVAAVLCTLAPSVAPAATKDVRISGSVFSPSPLTAAAGSTIRFTNDDGFGHTSTQANSVMPSWDETLSGGEVWSALVLYAAGTYWYFCELHGTRTTGMRGSIRVPPTVSPATGTAGTTFTVRVASRTAPSGWVYDLQRRKGSGAWAGWKTGVTAATHAVTGRALGRGDHYFRARLRRTSNAATTAFSIGARVRVA